MHVDARDLGDERRGVRAARRGPDEPRQASAGVAEELSATGGGAIAAGERGVLERELVGGAAARAVAGGIDVAPERGEQPLDAPGGATRATSASVGSGSAWNPSAPSAPRTYTPSRHSTCACGLSRNALSKRWMNVTIPACACATEPSDSRRLARWR